MSDLRRAPCSICGAPQQTCGDDHMSLPPISSSTLRGDNMTAPDQPVELKVYDYYVGHTLVSAQLTKEQAEAMGAAEQGTAVDEPVGQVSNKEAERANTHMAKADANGADGDDPEALNKARDVRNRRPR